MCTFACVCDYNIHLQRKSLVIWNLVTRCGPQGEIQHSIFPAFAIRLSVVQYIPYWTQNGTLNWEGSHKDYQSTNFIPVSSLMTSDLWTFHKNSIPTRSECKIVTTSWVGKQGVYHNKCFGHIYRRYPDLTSSWPILKYSVTWKCSQISLLW